MKEADFSDMVKAHLENVFKDYSIRAKANLQHSIIFDEGGEVWPDHLKALRKEKQYAYQVDIVLSNGVVPLVAVELKCGPKAGYSTHDVLTYSAKAARHKELYPYLRYGMAIGGVASVGRKFFFTNSALDFVVAIPEEAQLQRLERVVHHQVELAKDGLKILDRNAAPRVASWQNGLQWDWASTSVARDDEPDEED